MDISIDNSKTKIVILADTSGSMASMGSTPRKKINDFIKEQTGDVTVDMWVFSDSCNQIYKNIKSNEFNLNSHDLQTNGSTSLYQSACYVIDVTGDDLAKMIEYRPGHIIFVIFTDGEENASTGIYQGENGRLLLKQKIEHQQEVYKWTFFFLGANIDAIHTGESIGISRQTCINYSADIKGCENVFRSASNAVTRLRSNDKHVAFTDEERSSSVMPIENNIYSVSNFVTRASSHSVMPIENMRI